MTDKPAASQRVEAPQLAITNAQMNDLLKRAEMHLSGRYFEDGSPFPMVTNARAIMAREMASFAANEILRILGKERI